MMTRERWSMKKYNIGFLAGFFDLLHDGHIDIMRRSKEQCEYLIVAVGTDDFMIRRKKHKSVLCYEQRIEIVKSIRYVDKVVPETNLDKIAAYKEYKFDVMFAGSDHINETVYVDAARKLKKYGVDTIFIPRKAKVSSTEIRKRINEMFLS